MPYQCIVICFIQQNCYLYSSHVKWFFGTALWIAAPTPASRNGEVVTQSALVLQKMEEVLCVNRLMFTLTRMEIIHCYKFQWFIWTVVNCNSAMHFCRQDLVEPEIKSRFPEFFSKGRKARVIWVNAQHKLLDCIFSCICIHPDSIPFFLVRLISITHTY